jgi:hypothetical protein
MRMVATVRGTARHTAWVAAVLVVELDRSSADGPVVRLAGPAAGIALLQAMCRRLAAGERSIQLSDLPAVQLASAADVVLRCGARTGGLRLHGPVPLTVTFDGTAEQWETRVQLLDPLIKSLRAGFQYLDYDRTGDAAVIAELITSPDTSPNVSRWARALAQAPLAAMTPDGSQQSHSVVSGSGRLAPPLAA